MFVPIKKNEDINLSSDNSVQIVNAEASAKNEQQELIQQCSTDVNGQTQESIEPSNSSIILSHQELPGRPDLAATQLGETLSLSYDNLNTGTSDNLKN